VCSSSAKLLGIFPTSIVGIVKFLFFELKKEIKKEIKKYQKDVGIVRIL
jgi:hypothetical protein